MFETCNIYAISLLPDCVHGTLLRLTLHHRPPRARTGTPRFTASSSLCRNVRVHWNSRVSWGHVLATTRGAVGVRLWLTSRCGDTGFASVCDLGAHVCIRDDQHLASVLNVYTAKPRAVAAILSGSTDKTSPAAQQTTPATPLPSRVESLGLGPTVGERPSPDQHALA